MLCRKYVQRAGWPALSDWVQVRIGAAFRIRIHYYPDLGLQQAPGVGGGGKKVNKKNFLRDFQQLFHTNYDKMFHFFNPCVCPSSSVLTSGPVSDLLKLFTFWIRIRMVTLKSSCAFVAEVDRFGRIRVILLD